MIVPMGTPMNTDLIEITHPTSGAWHDSWFRDEFRDRIVPLMPDPTVRERILFVLDETPTGTVRMDMNAHEWEQVRIAWNEHIRRPRRPR